MNFKAIGCSTLVAATVTGFGIAASPVQAASIVTNGGFEAAAPGNIGFAPGSFYRVVNAGDPSIPGWAVGGTSVDVVTAPGTSYVNTGNNSIDLAGTPGPGFISQLLSTVVGQTYELSFALSSNGGPYTNGLELLIGGLSQGFYTSPGFGTWTTNLFTFTASSASTELRFLTSIGSNQGPLLDDVSVTAVPVPAPALLPGLIAMGAAALRKRKAEVTAETEA